MAYDLDSMQRARLAEAAAFRRLNDAPDLDDWHEAFGAWLRAIRALQRETSAAHPRGNALLDS